MPHPAHSETMQSIGQLLTLQDTVSDRVGVATPPYWGVTTTLRVRVLVPLPQVRVHSLYVDQPETTLLIGQGFMLQSVSSVRSGHVAPPLAEPLSTILWCV